MARKSLARDEGRRVKQRDPVFVKYQADMSESFVGLVLRWYIARYGKPMITCQCSVIECACRGR